MNPVASSNTIEVAGINRATLSLRSVFAGGIRRLLVHYVIGKKHQPRGKFTGLIGGDGKLQGTGFFVVGHHGHEVFFGVGILPAR